MKEELMEMPIREGLDSTSMFLQFLAADINRALYDKTGKNMGFILAIFNYTDDEPDSREANFISNCNRKDTPAILRELANRLESKNYFPPTIGGIT